jgi:hypothetical protein
MFQGFWRDNNMGQADFFVAVVRWGLSALALVALGVLVLLVSR